VRAAKLAAPDREIADFPIAVRDLFRVPSMAHFVLLPNQRQRPGKQDCDQKQHADHGQWKPYVVLAIEQDPCRQDEQGDEANCGLVDVGVKLIENGSIVMGKFPSRKLLGFSRLSG
jgi:hypothetical protein